MTEQTTITPASDDLIEVSGQIHEEFSDPDFGGGAYVYTSAGHVIRFRLEDEGWRATIVCDPLQGEQSVLHIERAERQRGREADDSVRVACPLDWVIATTTAPARR